MIRLPKLPAPPDPEDIFSVIDKAGDAIETGLNIIDKVADKFEQVAQRFGPPEPTTPASTPESPKEGLLTATVSPTLSEERQAAPEEITTGCLPCALGHFSTSSGLLNEAVRFKGEGMISNNILDKIAGALEEQNTLERDDLSSVKIQGLPEWERPIAEEALEQSRQLRHRLESIQSVGELEQAAVDTKRYYIKLNRQWYRGRFSKLGTKKAETIAQRVGE